YKNKFVFAFVFAWLFINTVSAIDVNVVVTHKDKAATQDAFTIEIAKDKNFNFLKEKVQEMSSSLKNLMHDQITFYKVEERMNNEELVTKFNENKLIDTKEITNPLDLVFNYLNSDVRKGNIHFVIYLNRKRDEL
ncbi:6140_t:CDS:1, partial [Ambispora gerdemannii]